MAIKINLLEVAGIRPAIIGTRYAMKSNDRASRENDIKLLQNLNEAGDPHNKLLRQIDAWMTIRASILWWKQFDTYRMGVEKNSESTMHTITKFPFKPSDFGWPEYEDSDGVLSYDKTYVPFKQQIINRLNKLRDIFIDPTTSKSSKEMAWMEIIDILPESYMQERMVKVSYAALQKIYFERKNHKLKDWHTLCDFIETLPLSWLITRKPFEPSDIKNTWGSPAEFFSKTDCISREEANTDVLNGYGEQNGYDFLIHYKEYLDRTLFDDPDSTRRKP